MTTNDAKKRLDERGAVVAESFAYLPSLGFEAACEELSTLPGVSFRKTIGTSTGRVSWFSIGDIGVLLYFSGDDVLLTFDNNKRGWSPCVPDLATASGISLFSDSCAEVLRQARLRGCLSGFYVHRPMLQGDGCFLDLSVDDGMTNLPTPDAGGDYFFMSCTLFPVETPGLTESYKFEARDYPDLPDEAERFDL